MKTILLSAILFLQFFSFSNNPHQGFIENRGQIHDQNYKPNPSVKFILPLGNMNVLLKSNGFSYDTYKREVINTASNWENAISLKTEKPKSYNYNFHRVDIEFIGTNSNVQLISEGKSKDYLNFYGSTLSEEGVTNVHLYKKVIYKNLYPNIDVEFVSDDKNLEKPIEYNFILNPGANLNDIKLKYTGADAMQLQKGMLKIKLAHGTLTEAIPLSYWQNSGKKEKINYSMLTSNNETIISYEGLNKPITETLIIDPTPNLDWATYYGGITDGANTVCNDKLGNVFAAGYTNAPLNIASAGAFQTSISGSSDNGFIVKFDRSGVRQWGTYFNGTTGWVRFNDNAIDSNGDLYVSGVAYAPGLATVGAYQTAPIGQDVLLAKFNTLGVRIWATYYGDAGTMFDESGGFVCADTLNNVYLSGITTSSINIATVGAFQENLTMLGGTGSDCFLVKFNSSGTRQWATYVGGNSVSEEVHSICSDKNCNVYIGGVSDSPNLIATPGTFQPVLGGVGDGFIVKFNSNGNRIWGTYYGDTGQDGIADINTDPQGNIIFCGGTDAGPNIISSNAFQSTPGVSFAGKINTNGQRVWGTYIGTTGAFAKAISSDSIGGVYVAGLAYYPNNVITPSCFQSTINGPSDVFILKYDSTGARIFGTLYGGNDGETPDDICTFSQNEIYISGNTYSTAGLTTPWGNQPTCPNPFNSNPIAFIAKFSNTGAVGIEELNKPISDGLLIYPNPNNGELSIKCKEEMTLTITNELGQVIQTVKVNPQTTALLKLNLNAGIYFVIGQNEKSFVKQKVMVIK